MLLLNLAVLIFAAITAAFVHRNKQYKKGAYYCITKNSYSSIRYDKGQYAEYLIYKSLRHFEDNGGRFLFNIFIPKGNGQTTEIDVLLISRKGLFVFESKNYGGWIFGNEKHKYWTQTLPKGPGRSHKERFYNPVMQNASHIRYLKNLIGQNIAMRSIIVFSDRCILKNVTIKSSDINVINHSEVTPVMAEIFSQTLTDIYTEEESKAIYNKLLPHTQLDAESREYHIENVKKHQEII